MLQSLDDARQGELALGVGLDEARDHVRVGAPHPPRPQPQEVLHLLRVHLLGAAEDIALGHRLAPQLVHLHGGAEGDEGHARVVRNQVQRHYKGILESLQFLLLPTGVDDEEEHGGRRERTLKLILDGGVLRDELRREVRIADVRVVVREVVPRSAEGAHPHPVPVVNLAGWVQDGAAWSFAEDRLIGKGGWAIHDFFQGSVGASEGDDAAGRLEAGGWPGGEAEAHTVLFLHSVEIHFGYSCLISRVGSSV
mmetsp:Transcript_55107/g.112696  ORF Transcript_55107/g.112696 Transcript_55107/m.112696 type:complete len:252 (+) Transcript_55107:1752-2507(+)